MQKVDERLEQQRNEGGAQQEGQPEQEKQRQKPALHCFVLGDEVHGRVAVHRRRDADQLAGAKVDTGGVGF